MNIREGIVQAIKANAALYAIVGDYISSSFAPENTPNDAHWLVMTKITGGEETSHDGNEQLSHPTFQFTIGGPDKLKVDEAQRLLVAFAGTNFDYVEDGKTFQLTFLYSDDRDDWEHGSRLFKALVDLEVWVETS